LAQLALTTRGHQSLFKALDDMAGRWLALGGGGYDIGVVPRSWALAFGVMSGQTLPDELPPKYRDVYGGQWLRDHEIIMLGQEDRERLRQETEEIIMTVKRLHGL
jgi:acetoin utilization deacetylase AcuC-like enzyme